MKLSSITKLCKSAKSTVITHSPGILTGIGITGMITATVMAVKATPKALVCIEEEKRTINHDLMEEAKINEKEVPPKIDHLPFTSIVKATWKCYIPAAVTGVMSAACIVGASSVNAKRNTALATAYAISETTLRDYQKKVVETIGEKKEQTVREAVAKEHLEKNPVENKEVLITQKGNTLCYDELSGRYFKSDAETLRRAANVLDRRLRDEMFISLNDFYYEIGLPQVKLGDILGWNVDNDSIELRLSSQLASDDTPCLVIDYECAPRYEYRNLL